MHHVELLRYLICHIHPGDLTTQDRHALIDLLGACLALDRSTTSGGGRPFIGPAR